MPRSTHGQHSSAAAGWAELPVICNINSRKESRKEKKGEKNRGIFVRRDARVFSNGEEKKKYEMAIVFVFVFFQHFFGSVCCQGEPMNSFHFLGIIQNP